MTGLGESRDLVEVVLGFWSGTSNVFCFPWEPMTPTLLDVCVITGLPTVATVAVDGSVTDDDAAAAGVGQPRSYGPFISENKGKLSRLHHICFQALWLNIGIFPVESGKSLCLEVQQYKRTFNRTQAFKTIFESSPDIGVMVQQLSRDWWLKSFGNICHSEAENGRWDNIGPFGLTSVWSHLLSVRDIFYGSKSVQSRNVGANMHAEYYHANMVARQFGFAQSVPHFEVACWNTGRLGREKLTMAQYTAHKELMAVRGRTSPITPFKFCFEATPGFTEWWGELSNTMFGSGYEAIKTSFRIGKYVKPKAAAGEAEAEPKGKNKGVGKAKAGGQKTKKTIAVAGGKAKPTPAKGAPTTTRRSTRLIGQKHSAIEASNKENPVTVHGSDEESDSQESEKSSIALGESVAAWKTASESGGAKSKKKLRAATSSTSLSYVKKDPPTVAALMARLERTKAASFIKVDVAPNSPDIPLGIALQQITDMFQLLAEEVYSKKYDQLKNLLSAIQTSLVDDNMAAAIRLILGEAAQK
ncbi:OLC1v1013917C1 [Oldenlandia corymbosa var. corymbosa]|uniref:OLC1v1013917C1 n=1 Tax=Oldenlandia corymbosa var. corymbosa TaxID=529605 RepID=A0AAV1E2R1_OLDCO|nr:OLC1v1013917C1 [Oldenlandia corymbosa var. corymbosa]